jgi:DNA invertase Pin-like site-specific DNA recombinase
MRVLAYLYSDPLLEPTPDPAIWGWEVDRVYQDLATSKRDGLRSPVDPRPQLDQLLQDCQAEPADYLLIRHWEDLGNSLEMLQKRLAQLQGLGLQVLAVEAEGSGSASEIFPSPAESLQLFQTVQQTQSSRRIRQGHARNRLKATPPPGKAPYGYKRGRGRYVVDRATAPIVKAFFEQFLLFGSLRGAVRAIAKKYGKKISPSTGQKWLTHPVYRGNLVYSIGDVIPNTHEAILDPEEAAQVDRLLRRNRQLPGRTASAPRSLAGLVVCVQCGLGMTVTRVAPAKVEQKSAKAQREYLYLRVPQCPQQCKAIPYEQVLQAAIERICQELPRTLSQATLPDLEGVKQEWQATLQQKQRILEQLPQLVADGILDEASSQLRAYTLRTELAELQTKLAQLPPVSLAAIAQTVSIPQFWWDLSEAERRFYLRELIRRIELVRQEGDWQIRLVFAFEEPD